MADLYGGCTTSTTPLWESDVNPAMRCNNGATEVYMRDVNPNSSTYNQYQWIPMQDNTLNCGNPSLIISGRNPFFNYSYVIEVIPNVPGQKYTFVLSGGGSHFLSGGILPPGNYDIQVIPITAGVTWYSWSATADNTYTLIQSGTSSSSMIYNVQINSQIHIEITGQTP